MRAAWARLGIELAVEDFPGQPFGQGLKRLVEAWAGLLASVHGYGFPSSTEQARRGSARERGRPGAPTGSRH